MKTKTYIPVKTTNFADISKDVSTCEKSRKAAVKSGNNAWAGVVGRAIEDGWLEQVNPKDDLSVIQAEIQGFNYDTLKKDIQDAGMLPKTGKGISRKTGKQFTLVNDQGEVRWSEWRDTRMITTYAGVIAKVVKAGLIPDLTDNDGNIIGKSAIERMASEALKPKRSTLELFKQFLDSAADQWDKMTPNQAIEAENILRAFSTDLEEKAKRKD